MNKKVTYLMLEFGRTGGSIVIYNFMDNLSKRGYEVYAITPSTRVKWEVGIWKTLINEANGVSLRAKKILKKVAAPILKNPRVKSFRRKRLTQNITKRLINNWVPSDYTISTFNGTAYAAFLLSNRTKSFYHMQHFEEIFSQEFEERLRARSTYFLPLIRLANSSWLKNLLDKNLYVSSLLLNPGIDRSLFYHVKDYEKKYTQKSMWTVVSFFDEEREWKGFEDAVQSIKLAREVLSERGISINWKVYGLKAPTKRYATQFEYVGKLFNEQLASLYRDSDLVLLTSWYESFPLPPIEAMSCGTLVITTQYGVEDYIVDNKNGLVVLPRRTNEIASKIVWALQNPEQVKTLVANGLQTAEEYSWERRTDVLEKILTSSINSDISPNLHQLCDDLVNGEFKDYMYDRF